MRVRVFAARPRRRRGAVRARVSAQSKVLVDQARRRRLGRFAREGRQRRLVSPRRRRRRRRFRRRRGVRRATILKEIAETTGNKPVRALILTHATPTTPAERARSRRPARASSARKRTPADPRPSCPRPRRGRDDPMSGKASRARRGIDLGARRCSSTARSASQIYFLGAAHTQGDLVVFLSDGQDPLRGRPRGNGTLPYLQSADVDPVGWERALTALSRRSSREGRSGARRRRAERRC